MCCGNPQIPYLLSSCALIEAFNFLCPLSPHTALSGDATARTLFPQSIRTLALYTRPHGLLAGPGMKRTLTATLATAL